MRIAVTGASGFIGRHVLTELLSRDVEIVAVTRNRQNLPYSEKIKIVEFDIAQTDVNTFDRLGKPDILMHLAWNGLPNYQSLHHFETELPVQYTFLKQMLMGGLESLMVTGTCFEYGMQSGSLAEDAIASPTNPYGFAKDSLRKQLEYLQQKHHFNLSWPRLFYTYGEGQPDTSLYPQLQKAIDQGQPLFNMSGGEQLRDYLPVTDVARFLVKMALNHPNSGTVNVCAGKPISVRRLVESWIQENNWNIALNLGHFPYPNYEPMAFWGNNTKLHSILAGIE